jgi:hypothetical protein
VLGGGWKPAPIAASLGAMRSAAKMSPKPLFTVIACAQLA